MNVVCSFWDAIDQNRSEPTIRKILSNRLATKPTKDKQAAFPGTKLKGKEAQTEVFLSTTQYEHWLYRPLLYDVNILGFTKSS